LDSNGNLGSDGILDYNSLTPNTFGNFNISTVLIKTAFSKSDEVNSEAFDAFTFLAAYSGQDANKITTSAFRDIPIPNWDLKYAGFMKFSWFKKRFKRFSVTHGYRSAYTVKGCLVISI